VSKGVLVALEATGASQPEHAVPLADAFSVSLTSSWTPAKRRCCAVRRSRGEHAVARPGRRTASCCCHRPAAPVELWWWRLEPGEVRHSEAHASGTREALLVIEARSGESEGQLSVAPAGTAVAWPATSHTPTAHGAHRSARAVVTVPQ